MTAARSTPAGAATIGWFDLPPVRHPAAYGWFIFVSALDVMLTWIILLVMDGIEVNPIAHAVIQHAGLRGLVVFKFTLVVFVIVMCEWVSRRNARAGVKLAEWSVAITAIPVVIALGLMLTSD